MGYLYQKTRSNGHTLDEISFRENKRKNQFKIRAVDEWNRLSRFVLDANTTKRFNWRLQDLWMETEGGG